MRALVTGASGFVGSWLRAHLEESGDEVVLPEEDFDVNDATMVADVVAGARPDAIYHLAGLAHVGASWERPGAFFATNAGGTLNVLDAARRCRPGPRVLVVSSAEVYGTVKPDQLPLSEDAPMRPVSPYAASKAAAEMVAVQAHLGWELDVIRARPFNHVGPGQSPTFVVPALAGRIVDAQRSGRTEVRVGNLATRRDFTDVRDVVRAYRLLVELGEPGQAYNVCSGRDVAMEEVMAQLLALSGVQLEVRPDPHLMRPVEVPVLRGDPSRLRAATGWEPSIPLPASLRDVLASLEGSPGFSSPN